MRWLIIPLAVLVTSGAACPRRFDPSARPSLPSSGEPQARTRFDAARTRFENAEYAAAQTELRDVARDFPQDPIVPYARLYEGMSARRQGNAQAAVDVLEPLAADGKAPDEIRQRARFHLGLSLAAVGRHDEAQAILTPLAGSVGSGEEEGELYAALAESAAARHQSAEALGWYDRFFAVGRPAEKAYVSARVSALVDGLDPAGARAAFDRAAKDGPSAAYLGRRLAAEARAAGDDARARSLLSETSAARAAVGLPGEEAGGPAGAGDPQIVGAVLPLSGKRRLVGEATARGLTLAAGTYDRGAGGGVAVDGIPLPFEVTLEDAGEGKGRAAAAVEALAAAGAVAIVGPVDRDAVEEAGARASALGVPLVTLDVGESGGAAPGPLVFRAVVSVEDRARALAARAALQGVSRFAILSPDIGYGTRAAAAFRKEIEARGKTIVADEHYAKDATSFAEPVNRIAKADFQALFIPDTATRLELVAPQLAVADLVVQAPTDKRPKRGRAIWLLSTAEAVSPKFLRGTGRYTKGALLAPGFYPDESDPKIGAYVARFRLAHNDAPTYLDAYAYDAALLVRAAVEGGARDRASVAAALSALSKAQPLAGLTGDVWFDPATRARGDRGLLYTVVPEGTDFTVKVVRR